MDDKFLTELDEAIERTQKELFLNGRFILKDDLEKFTQTIKAATMLRDLYPLLIELCEARALATPGDWESGTHPGNHRLNIIKPVCFGKYVGKLPDCEGGAVYFRDKGTSDFIALSANLTTQIQKILEGK